MLNFSWWILRTYYYIIIHVVIYILLKNKFLKKNIYVQFKKTRF